MIVRAGARTDIGRARERNEDSYLVREPLFAVADGMGGHRGGDVASSLAMETLEQLDPGAETGIQDLVDEIKEANRLVLERGEGDRNLRGMGTTVTALLAEDEKAYLAHVGDSRAYLLRDGSLQQLTEDHTLVQRMVKEGRLSAEEAGRHPQRSVLTRALGVDDELPVDELTLPVLAGDRLLLCTDGLTSMVPQDRILEILREEDAPQAACDRLVDEANEAGGEDNITVVVLDFLESEGAVQDSAATVITPPPRPEPVHPPGEGPEEERPEEDITTNVPPVAAAPRRRVRWGRIALWTGVALILLLAAIFGTRFFVYQQWYVSESNGRVAIYNGIPTDLPLLEPKLEETTDLSAADAKALQPWRRLDEGITATSLQDARDIVAQIRQDLSTTGTPAEAPDGGP